jgi:hypothetical protein
MESGTDERDKAMQGLTNDQLAQIVDAMELVRQNHHATEAQRDAARLLQDAAVMAYDLSTLTVSNPIDLDAEQAALVRLEGAQR